MPDFAPRPDPPYYAVIFTTVQTETLDGYAAMSARMESLASERPGYIGIESAGTPAGTGITVSYWADEGALKNWKAVAEHALAQKIGKERWYKHYVLRVARIERQYDGPKAR